MVDYYYQGNMGLSNKKLIVIALVAFLIITPLAYWQITHLSSSYDVNGTPTITFDCNYNPCGPFRTLLTVQNHEVSVPLIVNATYSCNCSVVGNPDIFTYSPNFISTNGTTY